MMKWFRAIGRSVLFVCFVVLMAATFCSNFRAVVVGGHFYYEDGDCYARMTRVKMVLEHPLTVIVHHSFENYPIGTTPHTTMPMDWLIALLSLLLKPLSAQSVDLAGALISPLLGILTGIFLWIWMTKKRMRYRGAALFLFAVSPIIVHGFALGRPDHQSLLMGLIAVGIVAEWSLIFSRNPKTSLTAKSTSNPDFQVRSGKDDGINTQNASAPRSDAPANDELSFFQKFRKFRVFSRQPSDPISGDSLTANALRGWALASGIAWGLAFWVSLYEPLILLALILISHAIFNRKTFATKERLAGLIAFVAILLIAFLVEGWRYHWPDATLREYFPRWEKEVGELTSVTPWNLLTFSWAGWLLAISPILLAVRAWRDRTVWPKFALLLAVYALTLWQIRWGYFFALIFVLTFPLQLQALQKLLRWRWLVWAVFVVALWPVARVWDSQLFLNDNGLRRLIVQRDEAIGLRDVAAFLKNVPPPNTSTVSTVSQNGVLAPWWESPALAYWSGKPCVAGTSHESMAGIVDSAKFYMTANDEAALAILKKRKVRYVVAGNPNYELETSAQLLNKKAPAHNMAETLFGSPHSAPPFLRLVYGNPLFKVFRVSRLLR